MCFSFYKPYQTKPSSSWKFPSIKNSNYVISNCILVIQNPLNDAHGVLSWFRSIFLLSTRATKAVTFAQLQPFSIASITFASDPTLPSLVLVELWSISVLQGASEICTEKSMGLFIFIASYNISKGFQNASINASKVFWVCVKLVVGVTFLLASQNSNI